MNTPVVNQERFFVTFFFILLGFILIQLLGVFRLFFKPILWAIILTMVFYPLYHRLLFALRGRKNLSAVLVTLLIIVVTAGPMVFFTGTFVNEMLSFYTDVSHWIEQQKYQFLWNYLLNSPFRIIWDKIAERTQTLNIQLIPFFSKAAQSLSNTVIGQIREGAKNFLFFVLNYLVMIVIVFFFMRDGQSMGQALKDLFPMTSENKTVFFDRLSATVSAVVRGLVVTGAVQAVLAGAAFAILGVPFPVFLASLIGFLAFVPIGGAFLVWFPVVLYLGFSGHWGKAMVLFIWGTVVVSTIDNLLRPLIIGGKTKLPTLFLFLAILGGLAFYGMIGVFLGPIMLALFLTLVEIYRKEYPVSSS